MSKNELKKKLESIHKEVEELRLDERVWYDSALHAFLLTALYCVDSAMSHVNELKEKNHETSVHPY